MKKEESEQITFVIYKEHTRIKALRLSFRLLKILVISNAFIIASSFVFFPAFLYQWNINDKINNKNEILTKEISFIKETTNTTCDFNDTNTQAVNKELKNVLESKTEEEKNEFDKIAKLEDLNISTDTEANEMIVKFSLQNNDETGDIVSGHIIVIASSKSFYSSYPPAFLKPASTGLVDYKEGEHFSIRVYKRVVAKLKLPPNERSYEYLNILIYSVQGNKIFDKVYRVNEYFR